MQKPTVAMRVNNVSMSIVRLAEKTVGRL